MVARIPCRSFAIALLFFVSLLPGQTSAQQVRAEVDRNEISIDETVLFTVTVDTNNASVQTPEGEGFQAVGRRTGVTTQIVNRQRRTQASTSFQLSPTNTGVMRVGPALVILPNGTHQRTPVFEVRVTGAPNRRPAPIGVQAAPRRPQGPRNANAAISVGDDGIPAPPRAGSDGMASSDIPNSGPNEPFVIVQTSHTQAVVGEQIVVDFLLFTPSQTFGANLLGLSDPEWGNVWFSEITSQRTGGRNSLARVNINGGQFGVSVQRSFTVVPLEAGPFIIPPLELEMQLRTLGSQRRRFSIASPPTLIEVAPLPDEGREEGFHDGNVGRFTITAAVDRSEAAAGDPLSLQITVEGAGLLQQLALPTLPDIDGLRWFDPTEESDTEVGPDGWIRGQRSITAAFVPEREGELTIPPFTMQFYDPWSEAYVRASTDPISVNVQPGATVEEIPTVVEVDDEWTEDLPAARPLSSRNRIGPIESTRFWIVTAAAPAIALLIMLLGARRERVAVKAPESAQRGASKRAVAALKAAQSPRDVVAAARHYLGLKLDRTVRGTPIQGLREVCRASLPSAHCLVDTIEAAELAQYGGGSSLAELRAQALEAIDAVETS
ncbi:MAG: hypothetical protein ACI82G_000123 [Bradymonadia bacterium]|jgi:hypothetical protein